MNDPIHAAQEPRYDFEAIDLTSGSTHADVVLLAGENRRILELGPATGYMSQAFKDRGCTVVAVELDAAMAEQATPHVDRMIVGDLDELDFEAELGDERFDVIVAADLLEHLLDPLAVLRRLQPFLEPDGAFVLSIPNVAHGSVRLALLSGNFDYQEIGLLDRTHLRFFTRRSLEAMLDDAELGVAVLHRHELNLDASEVPFDADAVPGELRTRLAADPDATTYQFVVKAVPMGRGGLREIQRRLREQADAAASHAEAHAGAERRLELQQAALDVAQRHADELGKALAQITGREGELRRSLVEVHDQLMTREAEFMTREAELDHVRGALDVERLLREGDRSWIAEQAAAMEEQDRTVRSLRVQLRRRTPRGIASRVKARIAGARG